MNRKVWGWILFLVAFAPLRILWVANINYHDFEWRLGHIAYFVAVIVLLCGWYILAIRSKKPREEKR